MQSYSAEFQFSDAFIKRNKLGSGTYGQVWLAQRKYSNEKCGVKISKFKNTDKIITPSCFRELTLLSEMNYPHILHYSSKDVILDTNDNSLSFAYDYGAVDVRRIINFYSSQNKTLQPVIIKSILFQLLLALDYLHKRSIAHCDLTPSNLLLMSPDLEEYPGIIKIIDFGLSRIIETMNPRNFGVVTIWYRAPELLWGSSNYNTKIDIWAAGCIFAELLTGKTIFATNQKIQDRDPTDFNQVQIDKIAEVLGPFKKEDFDNSCKYYSFIDKQPIRIMNPTINSMILQNSFEYDLLMKMLKYNPKERITSEEALRHPYFSGKPICAINISSLFPKNDWEKLTHDALNGVSQ
ncbi:hypothetical protein M9Y10_041545 [Tritrichomonas musculus]|uniref:Protein kinase domain-containing protein n=1 Tax=Tritrichomonas musculus TaxID=1915356 RepID=A0ABR2K7Q8_9EUKA